MDAAECETVPTGDLTVIATLPLDLRPADANASIFFVSFTVFDFNQ